MASLHAEVHAIDRESSVEKSRELVCLDRQTHGRCIVHQLIGHVESQRPSRQEHVKVPT